MKRKINGKLLVGSILVMAFALTALAKDKSVDSIWAVSPIKVDGLAQDWGNDPFQTEKKVKAEYAFRNDSDYLYIFFRFNDAQYLSTIETTGMTVWISTEGKKDKDVGINFMKKKISADEYIAILEKQQGPLGEEKKESMRASEFYIISNAEAMDKSGDPFERGEAANGAVFNVSVLQDAVTYEFRMPHKNLIHALSGSENESAEFLGIGFEWGGLTDEMRKEYMKGNAAGGSGRIGISEGGRGGGGGQSVGFDGASPAGLTALRKMTKKYSFWTNVRMAKSR